VVKLCDVDPRGVARNVCEGYERCVFRSVAPAHVHPRLPRRAPAAPRRSRPGAQGGERGRRARQVRLEMPTAYRFRVGHCIRVLVCSGAHPRVARNLGVAEREWACSAGRRGTMRVHAALGRVRSALALPVCRGSFVPLELDASGVPLLHPR